VNTGTRIWTRAGIWALASLSTAAVGAQDSQNTPSGDAGSLEEILVTARRVTESLQNVPIAVTAVTPADIEEKQLTSMTDLQRIVPSLYINAQTRDQAQLNLRGQGPGPITGGNRNLPGVVTYFAEVPTEAAGPGLFYDLRNVQVLKGPQGTLFGRNTTGGAVLFEPARPENNFGGYMQVTGGNYDRRGLEGALNVPIVSDSLLLRVAGTWEQREGFTKNVLTGQDLDDRDHRGVRLSLTWKPTESLENYLVYDDFRKDAHGTSAILEEVNPNLMLSPAALPPSAYPMFGPVLAATFRARFPNGIPLFLGGASAPPTVLQQLATLPPAQAGALIGAIIARGGFSAIPSPALEGALAQQQALGIRKLSSDMVYADKSHNWGITDILTWDVTDTVTLKNIFGYRRNKSGIANDYSGTSIPILRSQPFGGDYASDMEQTSDELQLQFKGDKLTWIAGAYYEKVEPKELLGLDTVQLGQQAFRFTAPEDESQALFTQGSYDLSSWIEGLKVNAGYRYTWDDRRGYTDTLIPASLPPNQAGTRCSVNGIPQPNSACVLQVDGEFSAGSWLFGLDYQINPRTLVYLTARRGYKSGGFNLPSPNPPTTDSYDPETVTDMELGLKADWDVGMPLRTNIAVYRDRYEGAQVTSAVVAGGGVTTAITNADSESKVTGFEFEGTILPSDYFELSAYYSYTRARFGRYSVPGTLTFPAPVDLTGEQFPLVPENKYGATARVTLPAGSAGEFQLIADWSHTDEVSVADVRDPLLATFPGYQLLNLKLDWNVGTTGLTASLFATNVTDEEYRVGGYPIYSGIGFTSTLWGEPRMWGAQVRYSFGGAER
jgi:iron complex outermembrane receptor protein